MYSLGQVVYMANLNRQRPAMRHPLYYESLPGAITHQWKDLSGRCWSSSPSNSGRRLLTPRPLIVVLPLLEGRKSRTWRFGMKISAIREDVSTFLSRSLMSSNCLTHYQNSRVGLEPSE